MPYQHLTLEERSMMAPMWILGWSIRDIATQLGRAPSTISRELRRNSDGTGAYAGYWAHRDAPPPPCRSTFMADEWCVGDVCAGETAVPMVAIIGVTSCCKTLS